MARPQMFVSHVSEETRLAEILKEHISRDFLGMLDVFVSFRPGEHSDRNELAKQPRRRT